MRLLLEKSDPTVALKRYEVERLLAMNATVGANRQSGPDRVLDVVAARAPNGFESIDQVISSNEILEITEAYRRTAGWNVEAVNQRPPIIPAELRKMVQ